MTLAILMNIGFAASNAGAATAKTQIYVIQAGRGNV